MSRVYATGRHSKAMCDRCGWKYPYRDLRQEWNGLWVCQECYDPKHEQLEPHRDTYDPTALDHARPDNDDDGSDEITQLKDVIEMHHGDT